jgi:hypothetical protein
MFNVSFDVIQIIEFLMMLATTISAIIIAWTSRSFKLMLAETKEAILNRISSLLGGYVRLEVYERDLEQLFSAIAEVKVLISDMDKACIEKRKLLVSAIGHSPGIIKE